MSFRAGRLTVTDRRFSWSPRNRHRVALDVDILDIERIDATRGMGVGGLNLVVRLRDGSNWAFFMGQRSVVELFLASRALLHQERNARS